MAITKDRKDILDMLKSKKLIAIENPAAKPAAKPDPHLAALIAVKNAIEAIMAKQPVVNVGQPVVNIPEPARKWSFAVKRDSDGLIETVTATRMD